MTRVLIIAALTALFFTGACASNWGNFKKISTEQPTNVTVVSEHVSGSDCAFLQYWFTQNVAEAARDALTEAPGAVALTNVKVSFTSYVIVQCLNVEGTAVK